MHPNRRFLRVMEHSSMLPNEPSLTAPPTPSLNDFHTSPRQYDGLTQQSRRLQLRNAGFRGSFLPARRISPIFRSQSYPEPPGVPVNNENSPLSADRRILYGEDMPPSPVNILQEIHNSSRGKKKAPRRGLGSIFQDCTATESTSSLNGGSWYNESSNSSPISLKTSPVNMMKLREGSLNQRTPPPLSSPLAKQIKGRNTSRLNLRSTSFEASKYIEHLESQLTALNAKLDTLVSPNTNKTRATKLRALTVEARNLRYEVADWEKNFAERVKEGMEQGLELQAGLKSRMQAAEDEGQIKDMKIKELEFENETLRLKLKDTESLEITNANLEKRVDVLTSLLVQSPTKLEFGSAASSPGKVDPQKRTPRPRSMLSPAGGVRLSLSTIGESTFWHSGALRSDSSISGSPEQPSNYGDEDVLGSPGPTTNSQHAGVFDEDSGTSTFDRSVASSSSRPTSLHSNSSFGATSWGLPLATERDGQSRFTHRQRRMRRFPSGCGTLKTLILPSAAGTASLPASAPTYQASDAYKRDISNFSLDPTIAFLSQEECGSPIGTPTQPKRVRSNTWAQAQALRSLEGRSGIASETLEDLSPLQSPPPTVEETLTKAMRESSKPIEEKRPRPRSLEEELKQAYLDASDSSFTASFEDGLIPVDEEGSPVEKGMVGNQPDEHTMELDSILIGIDERPSSPSSSKARLRQRHVTPHSKIAPKPSRLPSLICSPPKSPPSTALASRNVSGLCTRLTSMITRTKQDPRVLAQRFLYNAWTLGAARLGGIGWWLLGVLFGSRSGNGERQTDEVTGEVQPASAFDWRPYSASASRRRTAQCFLAHRSGDRSKGTPPVLAKQDCEEPHVFPCEDCEEPCLRRTFRLWFQFSLTIVLAVGVAIKYGPGTLLVPPPSSYPKVRRQLLDSGKQQHRRGPEDSSRIVRPHTSKPLTFAQGLGPADFEGRVSIPDTNHHRPS